MQLVVQDLPFDNLFQRIIYAFQKLSEKAIKELQKRLEEEQQKKEEEKDFILCRYCSNRITTIDFIIEVEGQYRHTFTNPSGLTFQIGCFSNANGCLNQGIPTFDFTWFSNYSWNYAICSNCNAHLGWFYQSDENHSFYGLILDNLI